MTCDFDNDSTALLGWDASADSGTETRNPIVPDEFNAGASGLTSIYGELRSLCASVTREDTPRPTDYALKRTYDILERTAYAMMLKARVTEATWNFPKGYVNSDDDGGIRIEWWHNRTHCVILAVGHSRDAPTYVFLKAGTGHDGKMNRRVFPARLASQLHELAKLRASRG